MGSWEVGGTTTVISQSLDSKTLPCWAIPQMVIKALKMHITSIKYLFILYLEKGWMGGTEEDEAK